jgi:hypothetical protein
MLTAFIQALFTLTLANTGLVAATAMEKDRRGGGGRHRQRERDRETDRQTDSQ